MNAWVSYLGIFGLGSVVTALVQWWMSRADEKRQSQFREKREAYLGILDAYRNVAVSATHEARMEYAYWKLRCDLVAPPKIRTAIHNFSESEPNSPEIKINERALVELIRTDLGISSGNP